MSPKLEPREQPLKIMQLEYGIGFSPIKVSNGCAAQEYNNAPFRKRRCAGFASCSCNIGVQECSKLLSERKWQSLIHDVCEVWDSIIYIWFMISYIYFLTCFPHSNSYVGRKTYSMSWSVTVYIFFPQGGNQRIQTLLARKSMPGFSWKMSSRRFQASKASKDILCSIYSHETAKKTGEEREHDCNIW